MAWISTAEAAKLSGLPRKVLIELADDGQIRTWRRKNTGWRQYWREDVEALMQPQKPDEPYRKLSVAVRQMKEAASMLSDDEIQMFEAAFGPTFVTWRVVKSFIDVLESFV